MHNFHFFCKNCDKESKGNLVKHCIDFKKKVIINTYSCSVCEKESLTISNFES